MITLRTNAIRYRDKNGKMHDSDAFVIDTPLPTNESGGDTVYEHIYLRDVATGKVYSLRVENGKLTMEGVDS